MNHIFLTGEIQIGKSTVIRKTLARLKLKYGGFCTFFGPDRASPNHKLYISEASLPHYYEDENAIAFLRHNYRPEVYSERFDRLGSTYIKEARENAQIIIMDECGNLENKATVFQNEILRALDGDIPILGMVKLSAAGWVDNIRSHPKVTIITVDICNRDSLPGELDRMLRY